MDTTEMNQDVRDLQEQAEEKAQKWAQRARESSRKAALLTDQYVHENAWTSVAIAVVLGCAIGLLIGRGRD
jgi:ElaB/YqjD/DUF883 family membrane-anchored ribosome-binding protein